MSYQDSVRKSLYELGIRCTSEADQLIAGTLAEAVLLLAGIADELHELNKAIRENFTDFEGYMQVMRKLHHVSIQEISRITGISNAYLYKIFRGDKRTAVRDYVILICRAIGMNEFETDKALTLNGMEVLQEDDARDQIIRRCICDNRSIRMINNELDDAGFPWLQFCKEASEIGSK